MDYKSLMGYSKKKKVIKEQSKSKKTVLDEIKQELNEAAFEMQTMKDNPPFKIKEVGGSVEYRKYYKKIEKAENQQAKEVNNLVKLLKKKGLEGEGASLAQAYLKGVRDFDSFLKNFIRKLM